MAKTIDTVWDAQLKSIRRWNTASGMDKAFWLLLKAKEAGAVSLEAVWPLRTIKKEAFESLAFESSTKTDLVLSVVGDMGIKHYYVMPKALVGNADETFSAFTRRAEMFISCAAKYGYNAALKSL